MPADLLTKKLLFITSIDLYHHFKIKIVIQIAEIKLQLKYETDDSTWPLVFISISNTCIKYSEYHRGIS